jgi:predicted aminopeptidase
MNQRPTSLQTPLLAQLRWRLGASALLATAVGSLAGCSTVGYYWQSVSGHLHMLQAARPVSDWLQDSQAPERLKTRLALSQEIRSFAVRELHLPDNASYKRYADLQRSAVVWNVVAAPPFSLKLKTWCFPVAGCVGYKGYFDEAQAKAEASRLAAEGLEVSVYPVPAYSTLGWMNWAGGDPLLNTFIAYPEGELARLIFHELAHQVVYAAGDTPFNESFATAVEQLGSARWLSTRASAQAQSEYAAFSLRRQQFRALTLALRAELAVVYEEPVRAESDTLASDDRAAAMWVRSKNPDEMRLQKKAAMQRFTANYAALKAEWSGFSGYDAWVARTNNASLGALAAYDELVPDFERLFAREGGNWPRFYEAVRRLGDLPRAERRAALKQVSGAPDAEVAGKSPADNSIAPPFK